MKDLETIILEKRERFLSRLRGDFYIPMMEHDISNAFLKEGNLEDNLKKAINFHDFAFLVHTYTKQMDAFNALLSDAEKIVCLDRNNLEIIKGEKTSLIIDGYRFSKTRENVTWKFEKGGLYFKEAKQKYWRYNVNGRERWFYDINNKTFYFIEFN